MEWGIEVPCSNTTDGCNNGVPLEQSENLIFLFLVERLTIRAAKLHGEPPMLTQLTEVVKSRLIWLSSLSLSLSLSCLKIYLVDFKQWPRQYSLQYSGKRLSQLEHTSTHTQ